VVIFFLAIFLPIKFSSSIFTRFLFIIFLLPFALQLTRSLIHSPAHFLTMKYCVCVWSKTIMKQTNLIFSCCYCDSSLRINWIVWVEWNSVANIWISLIHFVISFCVTVRGGIVSGLWQYHIITAEIFPSIHHQFSMFL
jgi:hypothetical protein